MHIELRPGSQRCQCAACHQYFSTTSNFDKHRVGDYEAGRRCRTAKEMVAKGLVLVDGVWQGPPSTHFSQLSPQQDRLLEV